MAATATDARDCPPESASLADDAVDDDAEDSSLPSLPPGDGAAAERVCGAAKARSMVASRAAESEGPCPEACEGRGEPTA